MARRRRWNFEELGRVQQTVGIHLHRPFFISALAVCRSPPGLRVQFFSLSSGTVIRLSSGSGNGLGVGPRPVPGVSGGVCVSSSFSLGIRMVVEPVLVLVPVPVLAVLVLEPVPLLAVYVYGFLRFSSRRT